MDFYVTHDLKMGDNNRVSLFYPDGRLDVISSKNLYNHYRYFMYYIMKYGNEIPELIPLYQESVRNPFFYVQAFLNYYQVIVILDTTFLDEIPISFDAQVYLPCSITKYQYEMMKRQHSYFNLFELRVHCDDEDVSIELLGGIEKWRYDEPFYPGQYDLFLDILQKKIKKETIKR